MNDEPYSILNNPFGKDSQFTPLSKTSSMPVQEYIDKIKAELSEHCLKLMERMDSCYEIEKAELTAHTDTQMSRINSWLDQYRFLCANENQVRKDEITAHADDEIARLCAVGKDIEETITDHADKEIDKIHKASEYIESNLETDAINNEEWNENPKFHCLLGSTFTESDIVDLVKFCLTRLQK